MTTTHIKFETVEKVTLEMRGKAGGCILTVDDVIHKTGSI